MSEQNATTSDERITRTIARCLAVVLIAFVSGVTGCVANTNYQKRILAQSGADPIAVACLYGDGDSDQMARCLTAVIGKRP